MVLGDQESQNRAPMMTRDARKDCWLSSSADRKDFSASALEDQRRSLEHFFLLIELANAYMYIQIYI